MCWSYCFPSPTKSMLRSQMCRWLSLNIFFVTIYCSVFTALQDFTYSRLHTLPPSQTKLPWEFWDVAHRKQSSSPHFFLYYLYCATQDLSAK